MENNSEKNDAISQDITSSDTQKIKEHQTDNTVSESNQDKSDIISDFINAEYPKKKLDEVDTKIIDATKKLIDKLDTRTRAMLILLHIARVSGFLLVVAIILFIADIFKEPYLLLSIAFVCAVSTILFRVMFSSNYKLHSTISSILSGFDRNVLSDEEIDTEDF